MATASRTGPHGGQTQIQTPTPGPQTTTRAPQQAVLHLRGADVGESGGETGRRIQWAEDVIDNEKMGKKKSKVCCIYHPPKGIDESSDESSSDSSDDDSDSGDDGAARPGKRVGSGGGGGHDHHHHGKGKGNGKGKDQKRSRSPNAYEKVPKARDAGTK